METKNKKKLFTTIVKLFPMNNFMKKERNKNQSCKSWGYFFDDEVKKKLITSIVGIFSTMKFHGKKSNKEIIMSWGYFWC